jgi:hypothetical protein
VCGGQGWRRGDALATNLDVVSFAGRSPSLPSRKVPGNRHLLLPVQTPHLASWPNPVAQTSDTKCLQNERFVSVTCVRSHKLNQFTKL